MATSETFHFDEFTGGADQTILQTRFAEALLVVLPRSVIADMRFPADHMISRPVHIHVRSSSPHNRSQEEQFPIPYGYRNPVHLEIPLCDDLLHVGPTFELRRPLP